MYYLKNREKMEVQKQEKISSKNDLKLPLKE